MTTLVDEVRISIPRLGNASVLFLTISLHRACFQHIFFLCSPYWNRTLIAFSIHVPQLSDWLVWTPRNLVVVEEPFWMVTRPCLKETKKQSHPLLESQCPNIYRDYLFCNTNEPGFYGLWERGDQRLAGERQAHSQWYLHPDSVKSQHLQKMAGIIN